MTAASDGAYDYDEEVFFIGRRGRKNMAVGAAVALFFGLCCVVAVISAFAGADAPVAGVVAFAVFGVILCFVGVLLLGGTISSARNARRHGDHRIVVDTDGFHELGTPQGEVFVPWSALAGLELVAADGGVGYTPWQAPAAMPNAKVARGVMTALRMYPVDPVDFAARAPLFTTATAPEFAQRIIAGPFGRVYYTEDDIRAGIVGAVNRFTGGRLGQPVDETQRARYRGSQF